MKRAAITGVTGMIGSALADLLSEQGVEVIAVANPNSKRLSESVADDDPNITILPLSGSEYDEFAQGPVAAKLPRCDVFFHLAWDGTFGPERADAERQAANVEMSLAAVRLAAALGCKRFVFAGSQAEYGKLEGKFSADTPCHPITEYGKAKFEAEKKTRELCHELGLEHIAARIGSAYGPGDNDGTVLIQAIWHAWHEEPFACTKGEQLWDHIYCEDAADALRLMGEKGKADAVYPVGTGHAEPLREHIQMACEVCNPDFTPDFGALEYPKDQVMYLCADISQLTKDTGFQALVPFEQGIYRTAEWYRDMITRVPEMPWQKHGGLDVIA
ncbi:MAG: NAD-dependent epimerase/dehydratase family protein [Coriobacteriales bacterium]|jgi:UDP-glucose 4-epimerase